MDFLQATTQSLLNSAFGDGKYINAKGKDVIVIGGGDTGNDCIGTSVRQGAKSVTNFELLPEPPLGRATDNPWPQFPRTFKLDYGHEEVKVQYGKDPREYSILSTEFVSDGQGKVKGINTTRVEWTKDQKGQWQMKKVHHLLHLFLPLIFSPLLLSATFSFQEPKSFSRLTLYFCLWVSWVPRTPC